MGRRPSNSEMESGEDIPSAVNICSGVRFGLKKDMLPLESATVDVKVGLVEVTLEIPPVTEVAEAALTGSAVNLGFEVGAMLGDKEYVSFNAESLSRCR